MEASTVPSSKEAGFGATERKDRWWLAPSMTALGLSAFVAYSTLRILQHDAYSSNALLSPFFVHFRISKDMPFWIALFFLGPPLMFRVTCYYYRKAYYRAFFADPPACAVGEPGNRPGYEGETKLPFLLQNSHRYFLYLALPLIPLHWANVVHACVWEKDLHVSTGTVILAANAFLLMVYTLSCHSLRHLLGGKIDCFSCVALGKARYGMWRGVSILNARHMFWAWASLFSLTVSDAYVWMVASGRIEDTRLL